MGRKLTVRSVNPSPAPNPEIVPWQRRGSKLEWKEGDRTITVAPLPGAKGRFYVTLRDGDLQRYLGANRWVRDSGRALAWTDKGEARAAAERMADRVDNPGIVHIGPFEPSTQIHYGDVHRGMVIQTPVDLYESVVVTGGEQELVAAAGTYVVVQSGLDEDDEGETWIVEVDPETGLLGSGWDPNVAALAQDYARGGPAQWWLLGYITESSLRALTERERASNPGSRFKRVQIHRDAFCVEPYVKSDGTHVSGYCVPATTYTTEDKGTPGIRSFGAKSGPHASDKIDPATGKPYAPLIQREGKLGGKGYTQKPAKERQKILRKCVGEYGYRSCLGSIQVLLKSSEIKPKTRKALQSDLKFLEKTFGGPGSFAESNPSDEDQAAVIGEHLMETERALRDLYAYARDDLEDALAAGDREGVQYGRRLLEDRERELDDFRAMWSARDWEGLVNGGYLPGHLFGLAANPGEWTAETTELSLYIDNDRDLYRQRQGIENTLRQKLAKGKYDPAKAPKAWLHLVDQGARDYVGRYGGTVREVFPLRAVRMPLADDYARRFEQEVQLAANPAPSDDVRAIRRRVMR